MGGILTRIDFRVKYDIEMRRKAAKPFGSFKADLDAYIVHWNTRRSQVELKELVPEEFRDQSLAA